MRFKYFLAVLLFFPSLRSISQVYPKPVDCECKKTPLADTISIIQKTSRILAISFKDHLYLASDEEAYRSTNTKKRVSIQLWDWKENKLIIQLDTAIIREKKELTRKETRQLYQILYGQKGDSAKPLPIQQVYCYYPHHGFIFYNATNEPFAYLEICLSCTKESGSNGAYFGEFCTGRHTLFRSFFRSLNWQFYLSKNEY